LSGDNSGVILEAMRQMAVSVPGNEIRVGDTMRFRMSKYETPRWLKVVAVTPSGKRVHIALEGGCCDVVSIRNKSDWRQVIKPALSNPSDPTEQHDPKKES
jgi:hypothetical protein